MYLNHTLTWSEFRRNFAGIEGSPLFVQFGPIGPLKVDITLSHYYRFGSMSCCK